MLIKDTLIESDLNKLLGINSRANIPIKLLMLIQDADIGNIVINPSDRGYKIIKVTRLIKNKAILILNFKHIKHSYV